MSRLASMERNPSGQVQNLLNVLYQSKRGKKMYTVGLLLSVFYLRHCYVDFDIFFSFLT